MPAKGAHETMLSVEETTAGTGAAIGLRGVVRTFGTRRVLDGLSLEVAAAGRVGIVGRSGSGKSTLLSLVAGLDESDAGTIEVGGASSRDGRLAGCALMPQRDCLLPWRTALDNAALALENAGWSRREARGRALPLLGRLGLAGSEQLRPVKLSGGMRQRVAFARTLLADKPVLLLDEPFGALDAITRAELQHWLVEVLADVPRTVLLVTHDVEEALLLCDRVIVLAAGAAVSELDGIGWDGQDRAEVVTSREFADLRHQALEAIA